ncbi:hypothetical protein H2200_007043 [Cladophialophora chaetospira]|uniref:Cupin type-2 domain-containing protein n=1 Tax=Cladophialophora chaetospira TaxID=386627 RepID=A0AA38X720_9EURO|nr:hypothetical protein H2200_007043 [Cladophialophora chaetospira]
MSTVNGSTAPTLAPVQLPPGQPGRPYVLQSLCGEIIYIPLSRSATRLLVTGKETDNAFAVVGTGGSEGAPIGFHYHRETHDVFLCLKGAVNVWADDQCRTLGPGDLASVPPGTIHQYQVKGDYSEFVGLIVPGGWEEFFRFIGEPYDGPLYPLVDERSLFEVLIPKLKAASEKFDMIPVRDHPQISPQAWEEGKDNTLPGKARPYFLRAGRGPRYLLGGIVCSPLVTTAESAGRFSIAAIEGSSWHDSNPLASALQFSDVHHAFQVADGVIEFAVSGEDKANLHVGETIYIPKGTSFGLKIKSRFAKAYVFVSGGGLVDLLRKAGKPYHESIPPEKPEAFQKTDLQSLQTEVGFQLV